MDDNVRQNLHEAIAIFNACNMIKISEIMTKSTNETAKNF